MESRVYLNQAVAVVGAGSSAEQAAVYLSEYAGSVNRLVRSDDLEKSMSQYLADRIRKDPASKFCCALS